MIYLSSPSIDMRWGHGLTSEPLPALCIKSRTQSNMSSSSADPALPTYCPSRPRSQPWTLTCTCDSKEDIRCGVAHQSVTRHRCGGHAYYPTEHHGHAGSTLDGNTLRSVVGTPEGCVVGRLMGHSMEQRMGRPSCSLTTERGASLEILVDSELQVNNHFKINLWTFQPPQIVSTGSEIRSAKWARSSCK
jgi:hypothetical protein